MGHQLLHLALDINDVALPLGHTDATDESDAGEGDMFMKIDLFSHLCRMMGLNMGAIARAPLYTWLSSK